MKPVELYRMVMGDEIWTLTSADDDQIFDAGEGEERYIATTIGRGNVESKNELSKANLDIRIPLEHELAISLLTSYSEQVLTITIFKLTDETEVVWKGRLASIKPGDTNLALHCESIFTSMRRPGLRARFQKSCRHAVYGRGCRLDPEDFATDATLAAITGSTLTVAAADAQVDGYYTGGMVRAPDGALSYVVRHVGDQLTLQRVSFSLTSAFALTGAATAIKIYPGCDHSRGTCWSKFNNGLNYGGFDWIPQKNPMGGSSIV